MTIDTDLRTYYASIAAAFPPPAQDDAPVRRAYFRTLARHIAQPRPDGLTVAELEIPLAGRTLAARLYRPKPAAGASAPPLLVYFHGGGWVVGDLDTHDAVTANLALDGGVAVVSVAYRLAPEYPFPLPCDDALDALLWLAEQRVRLGFAKQTLAVGGDSAGAHLATGAARDANAKLPGLVKAQLLLYPAIAPQFGTASYERHAAGPGLTRAEMQWYWQQFIGNAPLSRHEPNLAPNAVSPDHAPAAAVIVLAEYDPLHDDGAQYATFLKRHGGRVEVLEASAMTHGFARLQSEAPAARRWMEQAAHALRRALQTRR